MTSRAFVSQRNHGNRTFTLRESRWQCVFRDLDITMYYDVTMTFLFTNVTLRHKVTQQSDGMLLVRLETSWITGLRYRILVNALTQQYLSFTFVF